MCGIAGILHFDRNRPIDRSSIRKMTDVLAHRGPDGEGYYIKENLAFGHRRLSIIDLHSGDQPMFSDDKSVVIVFNGEIYNYVELRSELQNLGYTFRTSSDTEVIIRAYEHWGIDCQKKFNGMWAFALWDAKKHRLFLSRDRMGEKPLYYSISGNALIFGSELKSIFAYGVPREHDRQFLEIYLALGYIPAPYTFYKHVHKLKAGHYLLVEDGGVKEHAYWDLPELDEDNMNRNRQDIYENFRDILRDSVKIRMRSDVPYGAFLSGGLDSSSIVALMSEISPFPVETFTIGFREKSFDERNLAKQVALKYNTSHHEHLVEHDTFDTSLDLIVRHYDEPFGDSSAIPTGQVSKFAASKVKMVLTGDGGDEVLSGYTTYQGEKFAGLYQMLPAQLRKGIPSITGWVAKPFRGSIRYKLNRIEDVCGSSNVEFIDRYLSKQLWIDLDLIKKLTAGLEVYPIRDYLVDFSKKCPYRDPFYKLMYFNQKLSLPDDMLAKVDRMSMAYSLETRTPFLDYRLIEYMNKVHKDIKMRYFRRKTVLRDTLGTQLPKSLLKAPKRGFVVPIREWFKADSFNQKLERMGENLEFFDLSVISHIFKANQTGEKDYGNFIWMLFVLQSTIKNEKAEKAG